MQGPLEKRSRQTRGPRQHKATLHYSRDLFESLYSQVFIRNTGKPRLAQEDTAKITEPLITAHRKDPNGVRWKNLLRRYEVRRHWPENSPSNSLPGAGEGIRTPDPLITNQMLYRLSYASNSGERRAFAQTYPSDPFQMYGTIS